MKLINNLKNISIATIVSSIIIGLLFVIFPAQCMKYTALFLGFAMIAIGVYAIAMYLLKKQSAITLALGVISAICGVIVCFEYKAIISFIMAIFGIFVLASGVFDLFTGIRSVFTFRIAGIVTIALSIATIVLGIFAITKSTQLSESIVQLIGVALLIYAVLDSIAFVEVRRIVSRAKTTANNNGDIITDATIIEEE